MSSATPQADAFQRSDADIAMSITGDSMAFYTGLTMQEFIDDNDLYGKMLTHRYREVRLPPEAQAYFNVYPDLTYIIVLATPEDPDTVAVVPVLDAIVQSSPRLSMRLIRDDDDLTLLDLLLPNSDLINDLEELDLPQAFFFDDEWQLLGQWGPRPQEAESYLDGWLERNPEYETLADSSDDDDQQAYGALLEQLTCEMRVWYNSGLDDACTEEVLQLLSNLQTDENGRDGSASDVGEAAESQGERA